MDFIDKYYANVKECLSHVYEQKDAMASAAKLMSEAQKANHTLYMFGTGHSHMIGEDAYARAGGYAKIYPILEIEMTLLTDPMKSTFIERESGYADVIEQLYPVEKGDVLIVTSNSGRNSLVIEYVQRMKEKGVHIIVITSMKHTQQIESRHPSKKRLFELGEVVIDNGAPYNDATTEITKDKVMGPISTMTGVFIIQNLVGKMVENLVAEGIDAPVFKSSNGDHADAYNKKLFDEFIYKKN